MFVSPGFYASNLLGFFKPKIDSEGTAVFTFPLSASSKLPLFDTETTGAYVQKILEDIEKFSGKTIYMTLGEVTMQELVDTYSKGLIYKY